MIYSISQALKVVVAVLVVCVLSPLVRAEGELPALTIPEGAESKIVPTDQASDVRILIDISGSMRQSDKDNLRIPALNLIVDMLPNGSRAGVWTFGQWVNMLIPPGIVDDAWRKKAKAASKNINSHGLRTNIGEAMEKATWQFQSDSQYAQHTILLTDGLVDVADDKAKDRTAINEAERTRILNGVLNQYKDLGVKIHTIGLSDNADKILLSTLSLETGGSNEVVNNSEQLVKAFLKAFEQAAPKAADKVPLSQDNTFDIDPSIEEFTALVFRKAGSVPTQLQSPDGQVISQIKTADNAKWFGESVYDLVTVTTPQSGQWKIIADLDPDNQVTVVSDLKMEIANLPSTLFPGQQVDFEVYLHEEGQVIDNPDFLKLMTVEMTMTTEDGKSGTKQISNPDNVPADGRYKESIKRLANEGQYELQINVDGKTFKRMRKEFIQVRQPIGFEIRQRDVNGQAAYAVRVIPQVVDVDVAKTRVIAKLKGPDQHSIIQAMPWVEEGVWEALIESKKGLGVYEIAINVKGMIGADQEFRIKPDPIKLVYPIPTDFTHEYYVQENQQEAQIDEASDAIEDEQASLDPDPQTVDEAPEEEVAPIELDLANKMSESAEAKVDTELAMESTIDLSAEDALPETVIEEESDMGFWLMVIIPLSSVLLGVGGFLGYRKFKNKKSQPVADEVSSKSEKSVSLNDGMDEEDFDEDFDLSDSGLDDEIIGVDEIEDDLPGGDLDDLDNLDLSNDDPLDEFDNTPAEVDDPITDDIPDFDENFDVDVAPEEPVMEDEFDLGAEDDTSAAIDELDNVLDSLIDEDIPQLEDEPMIEAAVQEQPEELSEGEAAIDEALANLESELDDIDLDGLVDEDPEEKAP